MPPQHSSHSLPLRLRIRRRPDTKENYLSQARWGNSVIGTFAAIVLLYAVLLIPDRAPKPPMLPENRPFAWNQDQYWQGLESRSQRARAAGCDQLERPIAEGTTRLQLYLGLEWHLAPKPGDSIFVRVENLLFELAPMVAACPQHLDEYSRLVSGMRVWLKRWSMNWDMNAVATRQCMYRLLYGSRTAVEEVMLQAPESLVIALTPGTDEPSATPSATLLGVTVHSGDILVSRGGAPTSALIARGNDYPGNFSHVALVQVDEKTGEASVMESHIEKGVAIATLDEYLKDAKLRVMVLRLRRDLSVMAADPILPHRAASYALSRARTGHIAYDFSMDFTDPSKLFCSEVASDAYRHVGVTLWMGLSHISTPGVASWLGAFGVTHFETQEPSDLEYDPQLAVVAEWRDPQTLWKDHLDNAVTDVMLEGAEQGERIQYAWYLLPVARALKGYSILLNRFDQVGPIPEGMSGTGALRNKWYSSEHERIKARLVELARRYAQEKAFRPPYWELVKLARTAAAD